MLPAPGVYDAETTEFVIKVSAWTTPLALTIAVISFVSDVSMSTVVASSFSLLGDSMQMPAGRPAEGRSCCRLVLQRGHRLGALLFELLDAILELGDSGLEHLGTERRRLAADQVGDPGT